MYNLFLQPSVPSISVTPYGPPALAPPARNSLQTSHFPFLGSFGKNAIHTRNLPPNYCKKTTSPSRVRFAKSAQPAKLPPKPSQSAHPVRIQLQSNHFRFSGSFRNFPSNTKTPETACSAPSHLHRRHVLVPHRFQFLLWRSVGARHWPSQRFQKYFLFIPRYLPKLPRGNNPPT